MKRSEIAVTWQSCWSWQDQALHEVFTGLPPTTYSEFLWKMIPTLNMKSRAYSTFQTHSKCICRESLVNLIMNKPQFKKNPDFSSQKLFKLNQKWESHVGDPQQFSQLSCTQHSSLSLNIRGSSSCTQLHAECSLIMCISSGALSKTSGILEVWKHLWLVRK